jgi:hypothetical protein
MLRQNQNIGEYQYQEKAEDYVNDSFNVFAEDDEADPRDDL